MKGTYAQLRRLPNIYIGAAIAFCLFFAWFLAISPAKRYLPIRPSASDGILLHDIHNATFGFQKILTINLPSRTDHRDSLTLAAALTKLNINWIDGVRGDSVLTKVLPPGGANAGLRPGDIGAWRAHMNALNTIVEQNLTSALVFEDDLDWDIRIRDQLRDFALSSRVLTQPLGADRSSYADPDFPRPDESERSITEIDFDRLPDVVSPLVSPYGDNWDVLWLGHCGTRFPKPDSKVPHGRIVRHNDETVPAKRHLQVLEEEGDIKHAYDNHVRVVHHASDSQCSLAYGITQKAARQVLYSYGVQELNDPFDLMLRRYCDGSIGHDSHHCLTVQPQLFNHHRPAGRTSSYSDISDHGDEPHEKAETENIRWSMKMNMQKLLDGKIEMDDQFPD